MPLESKFQAKLVRRIKDTFPGCIVMKTDPSQHLGIPDLLILHKDKWASLECKRNGKAHKQGGQDRQVARMNEMSFSRFVFPENEEEVMNELRELFD